MEYICYMEQELHDFLINKTNADVVLQHIYPFAYNCISKELSRDIRSFQTDMLLLQYMYNYYYRPSILYTDLMYYLNNPRQSDTQSMPAFFHIIRRFYSTKDLSDKAVADIYYKLIYNGNDDRIVCSRIKNIFGMLYPEERTDFINRYLLSG